MLNIGGLQAENSIQIKHFRLLLLTMEQFLSRHEQLKFGN